VSPNEADSLYRTGADGPKLVEQLGAAVGIDGNTVDVGREMATLAEAGGQYMTGIQLLQGRFRTLRTAIREGR
jgi:flagellar basal body rod protein FlgB